ncbi:MAG: glutathione transport system permease protein [Solirubrobacteraceae bacterium]|jgi:peptide/nickel transport system permease protein|nr:glutathione transport system permease protein [Solirubrobacteraceae bacterium]
MAVPSDSLTQVAPQTEGEQPPVDETRIASRYGILFRRFRRRRLAMAGLAVIVLLFLLAFVGPSFTQWSYTDHDFNAFLEGPSTQHWFGTTQTGGDVYALTVRGMQKSLIIGLLVALFSTGMAALVGSFAGYFGGWVDRVLMWFVDLLLVLPSFLIIAILSPTFRGKTWLVFVVLLAAFLWMVTARIVRGMTISLRDREYVLAARYMGVPAHRIIFRHILPNISSLLIVDATINVSTAVIAETGLSYFGFGVQPPDVSLGTLIADGTRSAVTYPWMFAFAAGLLVAVVLAVNLVGDGLRDALDPTSGL